MLCLKFYFQYNQTKILTFILFHVLFYYFYVILLYVPSFKILSPDSVEVYIIYKLYVFCVKFTFGKCKTVHKF